MEIRSEETRANNQSEQTIPCRLIVKGFRSLQTSSRARFTHIRQTYPMEYVSFRPALAHIHRLLLANNMCSLLVGLSNP